MAVATQKRETATMTEWITGGPYAVAVEVEAMCFADRAGDAYLSPQTVRFLEEVAKNARAGDVEALKKVGKVFILLEAANGNQPRTDQGFAS